MRRGLPVALAAPEQVFALTRIVHLAYCLATCIYFLLGEIFFARLENFSDEGFLDYHSGTIWAIRAAIVAASFVDLMLAYLYATDDRIVGQGLKRAEVVNDATVARFLQAAVVARLAFIEAIAIFGLALYAKRRAI